MKSFAAISLALLAAAGQAFAYQTTTIQAANDQTGANANVIVPVNGVPQLVGSLFAGTSIQQNGRTIASSAMLQANFQGVHCVIALPPFAVTLNDRKTFVSDGGVPVDVTAATVTCSQAPAY
jgi:hypothetical protein